MFFSVFYRDSVSSEEVTEDKSDRSEDRSDRSDTPSRGGQESEATSQVK